MIKANNEILLIDTISVSINGYHEIVIEASGGTTPKYFRQLNSEYPINLNQAGDLRILRQSFGAENMETVEVFTSFSDTLYAPQDVVRIKARVSIYVKSIYCIIE